MRAVFGLLIRRSSALGLAFFVLAAPAPVHAGYITFNFTGSVTSVDSALGGKFTAGDSLSGSFTIDTSVAARSGSTSTAAVFDALTNVDLAVGAFTASSSGLRRCLPGITTPRPRSIALQSHPWPRMGLAAEV